MPYEKEKKEELLKGGQGKDFEDLAKSAWTLFWCMTLCALILKMAIVVRLLGWVG